MPMYSDEEDLETLKQVLDRDGFVKIPRHIFCLEPGEVEELRAEVARLFQGDYATGIYPDEIHYRPALTKPDVTREVCNAWKASPLIASWVADERLGRLVCRLGGWTSARLAQDDVIDKPPQQAKVAATTIGFHQDGRYIADNFWPLTNNSLTVWMALDVATATHGALQYARGSHCWTVSSDSSSTHGNFHTTKNYKDAVWAAAKAAGLDPAEVLEDLVTVEAEPGDVIVHHQDVWHGSGPNTTESDSRRALVAHLINGEVEWRRDRRPTYIYGRYYLRGETRPREDFFPFTYSESRSRTAWLDGGEC